MRIFSNVTFVTLVVREDACKENVIIVKIVVTDKSVSSENKDVHLVLFQDILINPLTTGLFPKKTAI